jgi:hypothetical protein
MTGDLTLAKNDLFASMEHGKPFASYIKTILGKVAVTTWDNFLGKPVDVILQGDPRRKDVDCIVNVWSEKENAFFKRANTRHFKKGTIIPYTAPEVVEEEKAIEQFTDAELEEIVKMKYQGFLHKVNKIESVPVLFRMKTIAEDIERHKYIPPIEVRISELQAAEFPQVLNVEVSPEEE